jgi:hypothetical protein
VETLEAAITKAEKSYIKELIKQHPDFNITHMANTADVTRLQMYRILDRCGVQIPKYDYHTYSREGSCNLKT